MIVVVCFENPLKEHGISFMSDVLTQKRRVIIPTSSVIGAYHIATRYLGVPKLAVKKVLDGLMSTRSPAFYPQITPDLTSNALEYATYYDVESWDGCLISLAKSLGTSTIFSLDKQLSKVKGISVVNQFPEEAVEEYHEFLMKFMKSK
ncbi:MAG: hypothetical protein QXM93_06750 [Candidatus Methanomethyliaceae archaeon]